MRHRVRIRRLLKWAGLVFLLLIAIAWAASLRWAFYCISPAAAKPSPAVQPGQVLFLREGCLGGFNDTIAPGRFG